MYVLKLRVQASTLATSVQRVCNVYLNKYMKRDIATDIPRVPCTLFQRTLGTYMYVLKLRVQVSTLVTSVQRGCNVFISTFMIQDIATDIPRGLNTLFQRTVETYMYVL